jgi:excinuclease ABC subunit B
VYISATPADLERRQSGAHVAELIVRPTGLIDPAIEIRPIVNQVDDLIGEINKRAHTAERVMVTTLTKRMAEDLTAYLQDAGIRVRYMHSEITTLERMEIVREFRLGSFDCLVGINLLREGLDIPECSLVTVLDADKEGFLRSTTSLIQTCGRAARNANGRVILYADVVTESISAALSECDRRRHIQQEFNTQHGITPTTIVRAVPASMAAILGTEAQKEADRGDLLTYGGSPVELPFAIARLREQIGKAIAEERYEDAIPLRDRIYQLEKELEAIERDGPPPRAATAGPGAGGAEKGRGPRRTGERGYKTRGNSGLSGPGGGGRRRR